MDLTIGKHLVYPGYGLCIVKELEDHPQYGRIALLRVQSNNVQLTIPLEKAEKSLRELLTPDAVPALYASLNAGRTMVTAGSINARYRAYETKLASMCVHKVAEVFSELLWRSRNRVLSSNERRMLDKAEKLLVQELSFVLNQEPDVIAKQLSVRV
jgi:CarD family transcriptional regulator